MIRYKQFFGVDPSTAAPLFTDLRNKFSSFKYKDGLMTMNWLFLNNKQSVLSRRWGCYKEYIGPTVKQYATMIQYLKSKKIKLGFRHDQRIKASIDCSNYITNELCLNPSGKWFDHKSNSCLVLNSFTPVQLFSLFYFTNLSFFSKHSLTPVLFFSLFNSKSFSFCFTLSGGRK